MTSQSTSDDCVLVEINPEVAASCSGLEDIVKAFAKNLDQGFHVEVQFTPRKDTTVRLEYPLRTGEDVFYEIERTMRVGNEGTERFVMKADWIRLVVP